MRTHHTFIVFAFLGVPAYNAAVIYISKKHLHCDNIPIIFSIHFLSHRIKIYEK